MVKASQTLPSVKNLWAYFEHMAELERPSPRRSRYGSESEAQDPIAEEEESDGDEEDEEEDLVEEDEHPPERLDLLEQSIEEEETGIMEQHSGSLVGLSQPEGSLCDHEITVLRFLLALFPHPSLFLCDSALTTRHFYCVDPKQKLILR
jgi:hypothetical protein